MMYFSIATALFLGLIPLITANPYPRPVPETFENAARGLVYTPRALERRPDGVVVITQTQEQQITEISRGREIQLTKLVEERLVIIDRTNAARDNVRKNHFKNRNKNNDQNVIIIIVTQIVDARNSNNKNIRYMTRQVKVDNNAKDSQFIMVQQAQQMTINEAGATATGTAALPVGTGVSNAAFPVYDPNAAPSDNNATQILPAGLSAPSFDGVKQFDDPAIIIEEDQAVFVDFVDSKN